MSRNYCKQKLVVDLDVLYRILERMNTKGVTPDLKTLVEEVKIDAKPCLKMAEEIPEHLETVECCCIKQLPLTELGGTQAERSLVLPCNLQYVGGTICYKELKQRIRNVLKFMNEQHISNIPQLKTKILELDDDAKAKLLYPKHPLMSGDDESAECITFEDIKLEPIYVNPDFRESNTPSVDSESSSVSRLDIANFIRRRESVMPVVRQMSSYDSQLEIARNNAFTIQCNNVVLDLRIAIKSFAFILTLFTCFIIFVCFLHLHKYIHGFLYPDENDYDFDDDDDE